MAHKVIFLCTGNSARSQMAEAFLKRDGQGQYEVHSAGLQPRDIHPLTIRVMNEIGIDLSEHRSKSVKEYMGRFEFDDAIIVCRSAEENCPTISADAKRVHRWIFDDPAKAQGTEEQQLQVFRQVRDQIEARLTLWLAETAEMKRALKA
ncbi:MAG: arsenate reductase ArsC [Anaerolineae bacterium]|jgi:arsenate reductase|nr:arsenate reductase ArsC [Anaerolineae bacterium]